MTNIQDQCTDFCRASLAATIDMMTATVQGAERLRSHQLEIINQVLAENAGFSAQISKTKSLDDLIGACAAAAGTQLRNSANYWSGIYRVATDNQVLLQQRAQTQVVEMQRQFASSLEAAVSGGPDSIVSAVQATVSAMSSGYGTLARAAAETARSAANQAMTTDAGIRSAATTLHKTA